MRYTSIVLAALALPLAACGGNETAGETEGDMMAGDTTAMATEGAAPVTVTINGVQPGGGQLFVALQDSDNFLQAAGAHTTKVDATAATVTATFDGVAPGSYAAAVIHDEDGDGDVALGETGPTEAWGLSGPAQSGSPEWTPAMFTVSETGGNATVTLTYSD